MLKRKQTQRSEVYFICRYWHKIGALYFNSQPVFKEEDCYDWLMNAVIYTLKNRKWLDPACSLYKDKNGPDKALNIPKVRLRYQV